MTKHTKLDLEQLTKEIRTMNFRRKLYKVLRDELLQLDHWKDRKRGDPKKGYRIMSENKAASNNSYIS